MELKFDESVDNNNLLWDFIDMAGFSADNHDIAISFTYDSGLHYATLSPYSPSVHNDDYVPSLEDIVADNAPLPKRFHVGPLDTMDDFIDKMQQLLPSWAEENANTSLDVDTCVKNISLFIDDMKMLNEFYKKDFTLYFDFDDRIMVRDEVNDIDCFPVEYEKFSDIKTSLKPAIEEMNLTLFGHDIMDHDFYPGYSDTMGSDSFALEVYDKKAEEVFNRLGSLHVALQDMKSFSLADTSSSLESSPELDLSDVGKRKDTSNTLVK